MAHEYWVWASSTFCMGELQWEDKHMNRYTVLTGVCVLGALAAGAIGAEPLPEPVAVGSRLGHSLCETYVRGPHAGKRRSLICDLAGRPAVLIYTRAIDPSVTTLLKKLDRVAQGRKEENMTSSCVLLTTRDEDEEALQGLASCEKFGATILAATPLQWERAYFGSIPRRRNLQKEAEVTVILLRRLEVQASYSFRGGELNDKAVAEIVKAATALLPPRKP
jgi:hypothetical protein